jgi:DNA repair protein RadB
MEISFPDPLNSLMGGLEKKAITNFYGAPGTGKTNFCLLAALDCIKKGGKVVFIDTESSFSVERLRQMTGNADYAVSRIHLIEPKTFQEQSRAVRELESLDADLIIVDSMVALYRLEYGEEKKDKSERMEPVRELSKQLAILSNIARKKDIPVVITSHMFRGWDSGEPDVVGGDLMKYWSKTLVFIEKTSRMSERKATIMKHRFAPEGGNVKFQIANEGIKPSGFRIF